AKSAEAGRQALAAVLDVPEAKGPDADQDARAKRRAMAAAALLQLGDGERAWPLFAHSPPPRARSHLVELVHEVQTDPALLVRRLDEEPEVSARRALLLALGSYEPERLAEQDRTALVERAARLHATDPDAGIHAACRWLLTRWRRADLIAAD